MRKKTLFIAKTSPMIESLLHQRKKIEESEILFHGKVACIVKFQRLKQCVDGRFIKIIIIIGLDNVLDTLERKKHIYFFHLLFIEKSFQVIDICWSLTGDRVWSLARIHRASPAPRRPSTDQRRHTVTTWVSSGGRDKHRVVGHL